MRTPIRINHMTLEYAYSRAIRDKLSERGELGPLAREIPQADASTQAGKWEKNRFMGVELTSKTLGLIGCGNIGSIVAERALGLRMKVVAYDPYLTPERALELGVEKVELDDLLKRADFITLHTAADLTDIASAERVRAAGCPRVWIADLPNGTPRALTAPEASASSQASAEPDSSAQASSSVSTGPSEPMMAVGAAPRWRSSRATRPTTPSTCTARRSNAWRARCAGWRITVRC